MDATEFGVREFSTTGVRIERWARSLTRAGQVIVKDGRVPLLTSYGREIDSVPVGTVSAGRRWFGTAGSTTARLNGVRYRLTMGQRNRGRDAAVPVRRFLATLRSARTRRGRGSRRAFPSATVSCGAPGAGSRCSHVTDGAPVVTLRSSPPAGRGGPPQE